MRILCCSTITGRANWRKVEGLEILGTVGLLEAFYLRRYLTDLRSAFQQLLMHNVYIDQRLLDRRLRALGLPAL